MPDTDESRSTASRALPEGVVEVSGGLSGYANEIRTGRHVLIADEPESVGGADSGPNPYSYLLAAVGSCKSMTMRMYANRKQWPLKSTRVRLSHARIHADDCADCESETGWVNEIQVEIGLEGDLTEEQRERLAEIADRCPVHRALTNEVKIRSRLSPD